MSTFYDELVEGIPEAERTLLPNLYNAQRLPSIAALAREDDAEGDVSRADFDALTPQILQEIETYKVEAKATAAAVLHECAGYKPGGKTWQDELEKLTPDEAITRHYALFRCDMWPHPEDMQTGFLTFEHMHNHWRTHHPKVAWGGRQSRGSSFWIDIGISGDHLLGHGMLDAVGLSRDTPMDVLTDLVRSGRLYCSCGDPALPPPENLDWPALVRELPQLYVISRISFTSPTVQTCV